jgi:hypothetical protein
MALIPITGNANWSTCSGGGPPGATDDINIQGAFALTLDTSPSEIYTCNTIVAISGTTKTSGYINPGAKNNYTLRAKLYAGARHMLANPTGITIVELTEVHGGNTSKYGCFNSGTITTLGAAYGSDNLNGPGCQNVGTIGTVSYCKGGTGGTPGIGVVNGVGGTITAITEAVGGDVAGCTNLFGENVIGTIGTAQGGTTMAGHGVDNAVGGTISNVVTAIGGSTRGAWGIKCPHTSTTIGTAKAGTVSGTPGVVYDFSLNLGLVMDINITNFDQGGVGPQWGIKSVATLGSGGMLEIGEFLNTGATQQYIESRMLPSRSNVKLDIPLWIGSPISGTYTPYNNDPGTDIFPAIAGTTAFNNGGIAVNPGGKFNANTYNDLTPSYASQGILTLPRLSGKYYTRMNDREYY